MYPFSNFTEFTVAFAIMKGDRPDRPQDQGLTDPVWDITVRCWQEDPVLRPKISEVVATLRKW